MSDLTPEQIFNGYKNKEIDKASAIQYFKSIIEESDDYIGRVECVKYLGKLKPNKSEFFLYLENLLTADEHDWMRGQTARIMIEQYPDRALEPIKWLLSKNNSVFIIETIANTLKNATNSDLKSLLKTLIEKYNFVVFRDRFYYLFTSSPSRLTNLGITDISEIKGLDKFAKKIGHLVLSSNNFTEIKGLESFTNLRSLDLHNNNISEIKGLENCKSLESIRLSDNQITEIKGLDSLKYLSSLDLKNNQISEIKGLENNKYLSALALEDNNITQIKGLEHFENLCLFFLKNNKIQDIAELKKLSHFKELTVWIEGNPITEVGDTDNLPYIDDIYTICNRHTNIGHNFTNMPEICLECTKKCKWKELKLKTKVNLGPHI